MYDPSDESTPADRTQVLISSHHPGPENITIRCTCKSRPLQEENLTCVAFPDHAAKMHHKASLGGLQVQRHSGHHLARDIRSTKVAPKGIPIGPCMTAS